MLGTTLQIDGQAFLLTDAPGIDVLKAEIMTAARMGAAFVNFDTRSHGSVSVLITPDTRVRFETADKTEVNVEADCAQTTPTFFDPDGYRVF